VTALLEGLAVNPTAPAALLLALLEPDHEGVWSALASRRTSFPEEVTAAIVRGRPAIPVCRASGCSPSSTTGSWAGTPPPTPRCRWR
jgi:hypothetical protein